MIQLSWHFIFSTYNCIFSLQRNIPVIATVTVAVTEPMIKRISRTRKKIRVKWNSTNIHTVKKYQITNKISTCIDIRDSTQLRIISNDTLWNEQDVSIYCIWILYENTLLTFNKLYIKIHIYIYIYIYI